MRASSSFGSLPVFAMSEGKPGIMSEKRKTERLTIDVDLKLHNLINGNTKVLDNHAIIELKREGLIESPAIEMLRNLHIEQCGFSKMALGMAMTSPGLKQNMFKMRIHQIEKMAHQTATV